MEHSAKIRKIKELKGVAQKVVAIRLGMSQVAYSRLGEDEKLLIFDKFYLFLVENKKT